MAQIENERKRSPVAKGPGELLAARVRVPQHVVYRTFPVETVILNLRTGAYHGVNPTGGRMLEALQREASVREAAAGLADEYGRAVVEVQEDLCVFCSDLLTRGLIEIDDAL